MGCSLKNSSQAPPYLWEMIQQVHLTHKEYIFCWYLVRVWDFMNTVSWHSQKQPCLPLFFSYFHFGATSSFVLTQVFLQLAGQPAEELIWQKTKPFSFLLSKFSTGLVSSHLCCSTAFPTTVELRLCGLLEVLKWDLNVILGVCYSTALQKGENLKLVGFWCPHHGWSITLFLFFSF